VPPSGPEAGSCADQDEFHRRIPAAVGRKTRVVMSLQRVLGRVTSSWMRRQRKIPGADVAWSRDNPSDDVPQAAASKGMRARSMTQEFEGVEMKPDGTS
jgi:hypothetical protein